MDTDDLIPGMRDDHHRPARRWPWWLAMGLAVAWVAFWIVRAWPWLTSG